MAGRADSVMAQDFLTDVDAPALLGRLKEAVYRGRIRMSTFFEDHDRLRTGLVTEGKFRTAIEASGIAKLTEMEMRALSAHYADPADARRVRYKDFLVELEKLCRHLDLEEPLVAEWIALLGAVEHDAADRPVAFDLDQVELRLLDVFAAVGWGPLHHAVR